jgi:hypothetical protein
VVNNEAMRASDSDREKVVEILRVAYTEGRLTMDEFDDRTTAAYSAKTWGDLHGLTSDLPAAANLSPPPAAPPAVPQLQLIQDSTPADAPIMPGRRPVFIPFLPVAILFLIVATSAHAFVLLVPGLILLLVWRGARRRNGRGPRGGYRPPSSQPGAGGVPPSTGGDSA